MSLGHMIKKGPAFWTYMKSTILGYFFSFSAWTSTRSRGGTWTRSRGSDWTRSRGSGEWYVLISVLNSYLNAQITIFVRKMTLHVLWTWMNLEVRSFCFVSATEIEVQAEVHGMYKLFIIKLLNYSFKFHLLHLRMQLKGRLPCNIQVDMYGNNSQ